MAISIKKRMNFLSGGCIQGLKIATAFVVITGLLGLNSAVAAEKALIEKWIDGEVKANYPEVTYEGPPITLRYSDFVPPTHDVAKLRNRLFDRLKKDTNGKLVVKAFWGNTLSNAQPRSFRSNIKWHRGLRIMLCNYESRRIYAPSRPSITLLFRK